MFRRTIPFPPGRLAASRWFGGLKKKLNVLDVFTDAHVDRDSNGFHDKMAR